MSLSISKTSCCVVGCTNSYAKEIKGLHFHVFPSAKRDPQRRQKWILAVNRLGKDGKLWQPSKQSRICSAHFVGGKKSNDMNHPGYIPKIFPAVYKKRAFNPELKENRYLRLKKRLEVSTEEINDEEPPNPPAILTPSVCSTGTQTDMCDMDDFPDVAVLFCSNTGDNVSCQTNIPRMSTVKPKQHKVLKSTAVGENSVKMNPFSGYSSVETNEQMISVCGVTLAVFSLLLSFLPEKRKKLSKENMLLLFLMKIKLGISYCALTVFFGVSRQTTSRIFESVLEVIVLKTKDYVFWPSREVVSLSMPEVFKDYKDVRCIIDCTEFLCERPSKVEEQVFLYSNYKGNYTFKYLISITPSGFISFISEGFGGRTTDSYITTNSGFLNLLEKGDNVMADKGFPSIKSSLKELTVNLIMPPFATKMQFSEEECQETYEIARLRIHVERAISRIRTYNILNKITKDLFPYIDSIVRVCAMLVNLQPPILKVKDFIEIENNM